MSTSKAKLQARAALEQLGIKQAQENLMEQLWSVQGFMRSEFHRKCTAPLGLKRFFLILKKS